jgi:ectoine hydroxylase-related dioxygenase (phytanoyl-CoA dioxygenase family)
MTATVISDADIARYDEDGAVCLRGAISTEWIERLRAAIDADIANPGPMKRINTPAGQPGLSFLDLQLWQRHEGCRAFVLESPAAAIVAGLMKTREVVFYHDRLQVREPGTAEHTAWHHDQPYYPIDGEQVVSLWLPLDKMSREVCVEYVRGSHRWGRWFQPRIVRQGVVEPQVDDPRFEPLPDIEAERDRHEFLSWDVEPGDVIAFHALTLHGATGRGLSQQRRRAWETRWCGDDVRYADRVGPIVPQLEGHGLVPGDPLRCAMFPKVWPR